MAKGEKPGPQACPMPFEGGGEGSDFRILLDCALDGAAVVQENQLVYANPRLAEICGYSLHQISGRSFLEFIHPEDKAFMAEMHGRRLRGEAAPESYEFRVLTKSGESRVLATNTVRIMWRDHPAAFAFMRDVTRERRVEEELKDHWAMQAVLAAIRGVSVKEPEAVLWQAFLESTVSRYGFKMAWFGRLSGGVVTPAYWAGHADKYLDGIALEIRNPESPDACCAMSRAVIRNKPFTYADMENDEGFARWRDYALELGYRSNLALPFSVDGHIEGGILIYSASKAAFPDTRISRLSLTVREMAGIVAERRRFERWRSEVDAARRELEDRVRERTLDLEVANTRLRQEVAERKAAERRIRHMALHDPLTGLPNRQLFHDRLSQALARSKRLGTLTALLYVDLDHFKDLNDTQGHLFGDEVLKNAARRLVDCVRECDTVARVGGDEFVVVLSGLSGPMEAEKVATRVVDALRDREVGKGVCVVGASVGISIYPTDGDDQDVLISLADKAMYLAKSRGGCRFAAVCGEPR